MFTEIRILDADEAFTMESGWDDVFEQVWPGTEKGCKNENGNIFTE